LGITTKNAVLRSGDAHLGVRLHYIDSLGNDIFSATNDGQNGFWTDSVIVSNIKTGSNYYPLACFNNDTQGRLIQKTHSGLTPCKAAISCVFLKSL
jgi:hypothetical protein